MNIGEFEKEVIVVPREVPTAPAQPAPAQPAPEPVHVPAAPEPVKVPVPA